MCMNVWGGGGVCTNAQMCTSAYVEVPEEDTKSQITIVMGNCAAQNMSNETLTRVLCKSGKSFLTDESSLQPQSPAFSD